jgi:hypothetical protein
LGGADKLDAITAGDVVSAGLSVVVAPEGSAISYEWHGNGPVFVLAYGKARETIRAVKVETVGDVVRLALADWHTDGGKAPGLPRSIGKYYLPPKVGKYSVTFLGYFDAAEGQPATVVSFDAGTVTA